MLKYVVQSGDTLYKIAKKFNTSMEEIISINHILNPNFIYIGQILYIPLTLEKTNTSSELPNDVYVTKDGLLFALTLNQFTYSPGEKIFFTLSKLNIGDDIITLNYSTSQRYDLLILSTTGNKITQWSESYVFLPRKETVNLAIAESAIYTEGFNFPPQLPLGEYVAVGWNTAKELKAIRLSVPFSIK